VSWPTGPAADDGLLLSNPRPSLGRHWHRQTGLLGLLAVTMIEIGKMGNSSKGCDAALWEPRGPLISTAHAIGHCGGLLAAARFGFKPETGRVLVIAKNLWSANC
jgi:hypothetical protein